MCGGFRACISNSYHLDKGGVFAKKADLGRAEKLKFREVDV
jgi:hypothetical protein